MLLPDTEVVTVAAGEADAALATLNADPDVRYAERDGVVSAASNPPPPPFRVPVSDPWLKDLYAIQNTGQHLSTGYPAKNGADMDLREAWNLAQGAGVTVAVVDTGVVMTHPDFAGQLATTADIPANGVECSQRYGGGAARRSAESRSYVKSFLRLMTASGWAAWSSMRRVR
jgi:subtilisin family serine protease